jgi:hypothetical protein
MKNYFTVRSKIYFAQCSEWEVFVVTKQGSEAAYDTYKHEESASCDALSLYLPLLYFLVLPRRDMLYLLSIYLSRSSEKINHGIMR